MLSSLQNINDHNRNTEEARLEALAKPCCFCNQRLAKYVCPRCNQGYCSVDCYRSRAHNECSDGFYQQQAKEKNERLKSCDEERKKMEATLEKYGFRAPENGGPLEFSGDVLTQNDDTEIGRLEEASSDDDDEEEEGAEESEQEFEEDEDTVRRRKDLELRFAGLDIEEADFEEIWERLDSREREEFVRLAQELEEEESHTQGLAE